jgi:twinkle protein
MFNCHYCGYSGCAKVPDEKERKNWMEKQPWFNPNPIKRQKPQYKAPQSRQTPPLEEKLIKWFKGRQIGLKTLQEMRITEGPEFMPQKNAKANTVQFNYYLNGELVNTKFRTGDKCFKMISGCRLIPYNIDAIKTTKECIITEGEMDALSFIECGRHDAISVPNGANANLEYLDDFIEEYFDNKETIYIASDTDTKGIVLREELLRRFGAERCRVITYGEGCKDANEHLIKFGKESLLQCIADAPEIKLEGIFELQDFEDSLDAIYERGLKQGVTLGHANLDKYLSFETKRLCIVTGIPGSGKSEFIDEMAERLNLRYGWKFAYFSPENSPLAYHAVKIIEKFTGKKFRAGNLSLDDYRQVKDHINRNFYFISPKTDFKLTTILERAKYLVRRKGIKALVIDPYNRLESEASGDEKETDYISHVLDRMTIFAQVNDILIILMAHPAKQYKDKDGQYVAPTMYDINGSANFYNKADFGLCVHRDKATDTVQVNILKVKFRHLGESNKTATFKYNLNNGRYTPYVDGFDVKWDNSNHLQNRAAIMPPSEPQPTIPFQDPRDILPPMLSEVPF